MATAFPLGRFRGWLPAILAFALAIPATRAAQPVARLPEDLAPPAQRIELGDGKNKVEVGDEESDEAREAAPQGIRVRPRPPRDPDPEPFRARIWTDHTTYRPGESIDVYFRTTHDAYVYIFDTDTRGATRQIFPNYFDRGNFIRANATYRIPDPSYSLSVTGPSGRERLEIIASTEPIRILHRSVRYHSRDPFPMAPHSPDRLLGMARAQAEDRDEDERRKTHRIERRDDDDEPRSRPQGVIVGPPRDPSPPRNSVAHDTARFLVLGEDRDPRERTGRLQVVTSPSGARIYVNEQYRGRTPAIIEVPYGYQELVLEKDGYYPEVTTVRVTGSRVQRVYFRLYRERWDQRRRYPFGPSQPPFTRRGGDEREAPWSRMETPGEESDREQ